MTSSMWLDFVEIRDTGKTKVWAVKSKQGGLALGRIQWHGPWRKYTFQPDAGTIWDAACVQDVLNFLAEQMDLRKARTT